MTKVSMHKLKKKDSSFTQKVKTICKTQMFLFYKTFKQTFKI